MLLDVPEFDGQLPQLLEDVCAVLVLYLLVLQWLQAAADAADALYVPATQAVGLLPVYPTSAKQSEISFDAMAE